MTIAIGIVLYNQIITESTTFKSLNNSTSLAETPIYFILDNSDKEEVKETNSLICKKWQRVVYVDMKGNKGLSYAYNKLISIADAYGADWIMTCDQDTVFPNCFFEIVENRLNDHNLVLAPIVYNNKGKMSPYHEIIGKTRYYINSGTIYHRSIFDKGIRFNKNLFLDYVDNDIVNQLYMKGISIYNVPVNVIQNFSGDRVSSYKSALYRFQIYSKDSKEYCKTWPSKTITTNLNLYKRAFKLSFVLRSKIFLRIAFR